MTPEDLRTAIIAHDVPRVVALLHGLPEPGRRALVPELLDLQRALRTPSAYQTELDETGAPRAVPWGDHAGWDRAFGQEHALHTALLATATMSELRRHRVSHVGYQPGRAVLLDRRPPWTAEWVEFAAPGWSLMHALVTAGVIDRPSGYYDGLVRERAAWVLAEHPELLERDVWALLTHDGEDSLRAADDHGDTGWAQALRTDGRLDRGRLLDATLDALAGDLNAYRAGWHTRFWRSLAVTPEEAAARADRLVAALGAAAAPVVAFAVTELLRAGVTVPASDLAPALAAPSKTTVLKALRLLDRAPDAERALIALGHGSADVQRAALDRIERWGAPAGLDAHLDVAATQRARVEALLGVKVRAPAGRTVDADHIPQAVRDALAFGGPVPTAPVLGEPVLGAPAPPPIATLDELASELHAALANPEHYDEDERLLDGILRHCADRTPFDGPLRSCVKPLGYGGWDTALSAAHSWLTGTPPYAPYEPGLYERRLMAAGTRAAEGRPTALLALPTHVGGWIDPAVLVERVRVADAVDDAELAQAVLRLAPEGHAAALEAAVDLPEPAGAVLRCALGGELVEAVPDAAAAARAVRAPRPEVRVHMWDDPDYPYDHPAHTVSVSPILELEPLHELCERAHGSAFRSSPLDWPGHRDLLCAADFRYGTTVHRLMALVQASEPLTPVALRLALVALAFDDDAVRLAAVDVLIAAIDDGRADADALVPHLREELAVLLASRLAPRLEPMIAAAGPLHAAVVRDLLDASLDQATSRPGPLLVLFDELCARTAVGPRHSRAHLATLKHKAAKALLQRTGEPSAAEAQLFLAARVRRAERWMTRS